MSKKAEMSYSFSAIMVALCLIVLPMQAGAATKGKVKAVQAEKERLVLMPLRVGEEIQNMQGAMETSLAEGLQQQYTVFSGEDVAKKTREIFQKESAKKNCDETRCMENIAIAFQSELVAVANVTKIEGGYLLALNIRNVMDNKSVYNKSIPCEGCSAFKVVDKLKELSAAPVSLASGNAPPDAPQARVNLSDPETALWEEAKKGNAAEDYQAYLSTYPKGKYAPLARTKLSRLKEEAKAVEEQQEQQAWNDALQSASQDSYNAYLNAYPRGRFAVLAQARIAKIKKDDDDAEAQRQRERMAEEARMRREQAEAEKLAAQGPVMVRIPGKNYEMGKYHVTRGEFAKFVNETGYDAGSSCYSWDGSKWNNNSGNNWRNPGFAQDDNHPATCINWNDAQAYVSWLSKKTGRQYHLPTEAEWEYACYGGSQTEYCGSNDINAVAWYKGNSNGGTHPVGQKQANGYGLYDMSGNARQWMQDWYDNTQKYRTVNGGAWSLDALEIRAAARTWGGMEFRVLNIGFRVARTLP